ncbi:hypothetical protein OS493_027488 [Desmophyllum pertusum]|uniref:Uncharacterized protein n=1 Tax=Desmophyllum pertusum TaxID=174260 RepID=A0A9W9Y9C5_9CNID|nr:hypothetical protein OS493_027488 [Desmophyllum pertusum]
MRFDWNETKTVLKLVLNHSATSLHSVLLRQGNNHAMMKDSSVTQPPWNPTTIDNNCLKKGFNVIAPNQLPIKSRIGLVSQETPNCPYFPFYVRSVGFGLWNGLGSNITCGEIYFDVNGAEVFPAVCKIYIQ